MSSLPSHAWSSTQQKAEKNYTIYGEQRKGLPMTHIWRFFGQAKRCCPVGEFDGPLGNADNKTTAWCGVVQPPPQILTRKLILSRDNESIDWGKLCCYQGKCEDVNRMFPKEFRRTSFCWFHSEFPWSQFEKRMYFAYCDFRTQIKPTAPNNQIFLQSSIEVQEEINKKLERIRNPSRKNKRNRENSEEY
jgi:hypothetical protein